MKTASPKSVFQREVWSADALPMVDVILCHMKGVAKCGTVARTDRYTCMYMMMMMYCA